jgi:hypothetical protein
VANSFYAIKAPRHKGFRRHRDKTQVIHLPGIYPERKVGKHASGTKIINKFAAFK